MVQYEKRAAYNFDTECPSLAIIAFHIDEIDDIELWILLQSDVSCTYTVISCFIYKSKIYY